MAANPFDEMYQANPPWEIGGPQPAFVDLMGQGAIRGRVLDAGCGTGDLAIWLAQRGVDMVGIDASGLAVRKADAKARARGVVIDFVEGDALDPTAVSGPFDTVLDCGLLHTFNDRGVNRWLRSLGKLLKVGGTVHVLCFSDREPPWGGPRRFTEDELRTMFGGAFWVDEVKETRFLSAMSRDGARSWLMSATFVGERQGES